VSTGRAGGGWSFLSPPKAALGCRWTSVQRSSGAAAGDPVAVPTCTARLSPSGERLGLVRCERRWLTGFGPAVAGVSSGRVRACTGRVGHRGRGGGPLGSDGPVRGQRCPRVRLRGPGTRPGKESRQVHVVATSRATVWFVKPFLRRSRVDSTVEGLGWSRTERHGQRQRGVRPELSKVAARGCLRHVEGAIVDGDIGDARSAEIHPFSSSGSVAGSVSAYL